jgi:MFS family permease
MARFNPVARSLTVWNDYPKQFWILLFGAFVNAVGGALLWPFYALYITQRFEVGLTEAGFVIAIFGGTGLIGNLVGGAMADRFGRKGVLIASLLISAAANVATGLADQMVFIYLIAVFAGLFGSIGDPAAQAMVVDLLPEEKRAEGFGLMRVIFNLAVVIGPTLGGILASQSYLYLFLSDAVISSIMAVFAALALRETRHAIASTEHAHGNFLTTLSGYKTIFRQRAFMLFLLLVIFANAVYFQMNSTLPVFLRDAHGVPPQGYGYILSMNALLVVLLQLWITRQVKGVPPLLLMTAGTLLYVIGFGMYGFVGTYLLFAVAMIVITFGEMLAIPTAQAYAATLAPEDMRGRYMAVFGFSFAIPATFSTIIAGTVQKTWGLHAIWYVAAVVAFCVAFGFFTMYFARPVPTPPEIVPESA